MEKPIRYHNRVRYIAVFVAAGYIVFHGRPLDMATALTSVQFYTAFAVSLGVALLLAQIVHRATIWLDARCGWRTKPVQRSILQLTLGVLLPSLVDLLLISVYLQVTGRDILSSGFLLVDFPLIVCFIIFLNLYYLIHYLVQTDSQYGKDKDKVSLTIQYNGLYLNLDVVEDILYFYREGRKVKAMTSTGREYPVNLSIQNLESRYGYADFYRINRAVLINRKIVHGYIAGTKRDTLQVLIKPQYLDTIANPENLPFQVTKEYIQAFRSGLQGA